MKKLSLLILMCFIFTQHVEAQNKKIFVSKQGGKPKLLYAFKLGYNSAYYTNQSSTCDTLICKGSGYERSFVDKNVFGKKLSAETKYFTIFNSAIRKTEKHIKKIKSNEGVLTCTIKGENISIKYKNADKKGNADIIIEVL